MSTSASSLLFAVNLKRIRKGLKLTQEELAERCDKSKNYISQLEMATRFPSGAMLDLLCQVTGKDLYEFFVDDETGPYRIRKISREDEVLMDSVKIYLEKYKGERRDNSTL